MNRNIESTVDFEANLSPARTRAYSTHNLCDTHHQIDFCYFPASLNVQFLELLVLDLNDCAYEFFFKNVEIVLFCLKSFNCEAKNSVVKNHTVKNMHL